MTSPSNCVLVNLGREVSLVDITEITILLQDKYGLAVEVIAYEPEDDLPEEDMGGQLT